MLLKWYENLRAEASEIKSKGFKGGSKHALIKTGVGIPKLIIWRIKHATLDIVTLNLLMWFVMLVEYHIYKDIFKLIISFFK